MGSGTTLIWGNTWNNVYKNIYHFNVTRKNNDTYNQTATPNGWGYAGTAFNGTGSNWDGGTALGTDTLLGYPCLDQPGRGQGDLLLVSFPTRSTARQEHSAGQIRHWSRSICGIIRAALFPDGEVLPIATTAVEEWWPIGTIIHPPVERRLLPPVRLMDRLALVGEPWPIARPPARRESPTLQPIRDRGTPANQIPTECSRMAQTGFCINALRPIRGRFTTRPTLTRTRCRRVGVRALCPLLLPVQPQPRRRYRVLRCLSDLRSPISNLCPAARTI